MTKRADPAAKPVFVDRTGTRRRWFTMFGVVGGVLLALVTAMLVAGFVGGGSASLPGLPGLPGLSRPELEAGQTPHPHPSSGNLPTAVPSRSAHSTPPAGATASPGVPVVPAAPGATTSRPGNRNTAHPTPSPHKK